VFFAERKVWKIADVPDDTPTLPIKKVGVIGAGTMGGGISMNFLNAGIPVTIVETAQARSTAASAPSAKQLREHRQEGPADAGRRRDAHGAAQPGSISMRSPIAISSSRRCSRTWRSRRTFSRKLDKIAKPGAILASNTSYLDIDEIAAVTKRPDHVLGMHFFSPANVMRLLEVVRGAKTAKPVIATAMQLARKIGKVGVLVGVCHGFVGNRMLAQRQREAQKLILEGAMPWDVDRVLYDFGLPMGPFAMSDLAGLDIGWSKETSKSSTIREILCEHGSARPEDRRRLLRLRRNRNAKPSPVVEKIILDFAAKKGINRRTISDEEILERCIYPMINEGAKILEEGKAQRASDIDIVWINGYGWPVYRGGPMFYADLIGPDKVLANAEFEATMGDDFKPAPASRRRAHATRRRDQRRAWRPVPAAR
jgi:3-hydroxyacyl-CoA dehydrogenase